MRWALSRRTVLKTGAAAALASQAALLDQLVVMPQRPALAAASFSDIQFDIGAFIAPSQTFNDGGGNVVAQFGPVFTTLTPAQLERTPTKADQANLANALATIEANFPASPAGVLIASVSYGLPYFNRLPASLVSANVPRLVDANGNATNRFVLEESPAFPTDVVGGFVGGPNAVIPNVKKDRFNVNVTIENNDILFELRSDSLNNLADVAAWFVGSNKLNGNIVQSPNFSDLFKFGTPRVQFVQPGLPRKVADAAFSKLNQGNVLYEFHTRVNPDSSMVMGFVDQQVDSSAPTADVVTFVGNARHSNIPKFTNAKIGDYFDFGSIAHFSHVIDDLYQFYSTPNQDANRPGGEPFTERVQYMFRSNQLGTTHGVPSEGNTDQFTNGGGPAFLNNVFQGVNAAQRGAQDLGGLFAPGNQTLDATFTGTGRVGHEAALQRVSRAPDGTPLHIRNDGPGFDSLDVPAFTNFPGGTSFAAGTNQFKLQFLVFMPTADLFARMRVAVAAQDFQHQFLANQDDDNGLERFITATRRQNFLVPPRRHRSFPLVELT
jgi:hypothetical protein